MTLAELIEEMRARYGDRYLNTPIYVNYSIHTFHTQTSELVTAMLDWSTEILVIKGEV